MLNDGDSSPQPKHAPGALVIPGVATVAKFSQQAVDVLKGVGGGVVDVQKATFNVSDFSESEKKSIEADINRKNPIGDTPAYQKFLRAIFPEKQILFPYLADWNDTLIVLSGLSALLGKIVELPNKAEAMESLQRNNHLTGYYNADGKRVEDVNRCGYAWISAIHGKHNSFLGFDNQKNLTSGTETRGHRYSVIPVLR